MATFDPPQTRNTTWQLPWLRVSLILRRMAGNTECRAADIAQLLALRRRVAQEGWFN